MGKRSGTILLARRLPAQKRLGFQIPPACPLPPPSLHIPSIDRVLRCTHYDTTSTYHHHISYKASPTPP